ncbi:MAG: hypothetical protein KA981_10095 [Bacteroidia bacterium]|nr:hypothetical protein [Bacteroidia bacterium]
MSRLVLFVFLFILLLGFSCKKKEVMVPSYVYLAQSTLTTKFDNTQGYPSAGVNDYYIFANGEVKGLFGVNATIPLQQIGKTNIKISPGIKYNGMSEQRIIFPMFNFYEVDMDLGAERVDTIKPKFTYVENAVFPLIEDYDGSGLAFEYNPQYKNIGDTLYKDNSAAAWLPGENSGKVELKSSESSSTLELYSKVFNNWPRFTPFYLELDYKGNIPITIGLYVTTNGGTEVNKFPVYVTNARTDWNKLYLDLESEINQREAGAQYRVFISFSKAGVANPEAWIDNLKVVYLD